jgi:hypothetical protein
MRPKLSAGKLYLGVLAFSAMTSVDGASVYNVRDYGATGRKTEDARLAIQRAIDACARGGGGKVYFPPGEYTSGTLHLRSHVCVEVEAGATLFASADPGAYDFGMLAAKAALFHGEDLEHVTLTGRGTVDGQAEYEWREDDFEQGYNHKTWMQALGKSLRRSFPKGFPQRQVYPHLLWLGRAKDVRISGLNFARSPSWSLTFYDCARVVCDGLSIDTSLREGVWADGIDLDGCRDVSIAHCTIATGDDCIALSSTPNWGPARACENVTINDCHLASASAGVKFTEGNQVGIRRVVVCDTVFSPVNRGVVFLNGLGGEVADVLLTDLVIGCERSDWFWAGDGQPFFVRLAPINELNQEPAKPGDRPVGRIRNVIVRNVIAQAKGSCPVYGHFQSWLENVSIENVRLFVSTDPDAPYDKAEHALDCRRARNLKVKDVTVFWEPPALAQWKSALYLEDIKGLELASFTGRAAWPARGQPAVALRNVADAVVRDCRAPEGTGLFLRVAGPRSRAIRLWANDLTQAKTPYELAPETKRRAFKTAGSRLDWPRTGVTNETLTSPR